jgi:hypothetical protein
MNIRVYFWNPNGTNDIEVIDNTGEVIDSLPEALFGIDTGYKEFKVYPLIRCLKHIAVSPVSDGNETIRFLQRYFYV